MPTGDRPLFRTVDAALKWAFKPRHGRPSQYSHMIVKFMKRDRLGDDHVTDAPVRAIDPDLERVGPGLDATAQAGMLQSFVMRQEDPRRLHLLAKYAHGELRQSARRALRDFLLPLMSQTLRPQYVIYRLVGRYYDGTNGTKIKELAGRISYLVEKRDGEKAEQHERRAWRQVREMAREVDGLLKQVSTQTEIAVDEQLRESGVIG